MLYGAEIYVDSENVLRCYEKSGALRTLDGCSISKAEYIINAAIPFPKLIIKSIHRINTAIILKAARGKRRHFKAQADKSFRTAALAKRGGCKAEP
jgi:hypothetical protein